MSCVVYGPFAHHIPHTDARVEGGLSQLDYFVIIQQLNEQLLATLADLRTSIQDRYRALRERDALEEDIQETINSYKSLLANQGETEAPNQIAAKSSLVLNLQQQVTEAEQQAQKVCPLSLVPPPTSLTVVPPHFLLQFLEELEMVRGNNRVLMSNLKEKEKQLEHWMGLNETVAPKKTPTIDTHRVNAVRAAPWRGGVSTYCSCAHSHRCRSKNWKRSSVNFTISMKDCNHSLKSNGTPERRTWNILSRQRRKSS